MSNLASPKDAGEVDEHAARRFFDRSAERGNGADTLAREIERRMFERLSYVRLQPTGILDAGAGCGHGLSELARRYPSAQPIGIDWAHAMVAEARRPRGLLARTRELLRRRSPRLLCADSRALPFEPRTFQLVWSNLALAWTADPLAVFREFHRVLDVGGLVMFSTYGPDTLKELRQAFAVADDLPHTLHFFDMHDLGDMLSAAGFSDPVMDMEVLTLTYSGLDALVADLRHTGQVNAARGRRRGLMGRRTYQAVRDACEGLRKQGRLPITIEVIYGHAWKAEARLTPQGHSIVRTDFSRKLRGRP